MTFPKSPVWDTENNLVAEHGVYVYSVPPQVIGLSKKVQIVCDDSHHGTTAFGIVRSEDSHKTDIPSQQSVVVHAK